MIAVRVEFGKANQTMTTNELKELCQIWRQAASKLCKRARQMNEQGEDDVAIALRHRASVYFSCANDLESVNKIIQ